MPKPTFEFDIHAWAREMRGRTTDAQALWLYMLLFMYMAAKADGHLPKTATKEALCEKASLSSKAYDKALHELEENHVFSRTAEGGIYSRRMVREANPDRGALNKAFDRLVDEYPNATMVGPARTIWQGFVASGYITQQNVHEVFGGLDRWKGSRQWRDEYPKFVPSLDKWLFTQKWHDKPPQHEWATFKKRLQSQHEKTSD